MNVFISLRAVTGRKTSTVLDTCVLFIPLTFMASVDGGVGGQLDKMEPGRRGVQADALTQLSKASSIQIITAACHLQLWLPLAAAKLFGIPPVCKKLQRRDEIVPLLGFYAG